MDGDWITGVRTAGLSAVAAKHLARKDAATIAFIGCGLQARTHLEAFSQMFPLSQVRAVGRGAASRDRLVAMAREKGLAVRDVPGPQEAIADADIVVTTVPESPGMAPFLDLGWVAPGGFVTMVDLARSWIPASMACVDRVLVDDLEQERRMADPLLDPALIAGDLVGLASGKAAPRRSAQERLVFAFRGLALGDLALAALCYRKAVEQGVGQSLPR
jgi:ornithine cyclodeaminase/alanine dehydrogenase